MPSLRRYSVDDSIEMRMLELQAGLAASCSAGQPTRDTLCHLSWWPLVASNPALLSVLPNAMQESKRDLMRVAFDRRRPQEVREERTRDVRMLMQL